MDTGSDGDSYRTELTVFNSNADSNADSDANSNANYNADSGINYNTNSIARSNNAYKAPA